MKHNRFLNRIIALICLLPMSLSLCGCAKTQECSLFAMDTFITLSCSGRNASSALAACEAEIRRLEGLFSPTLPNSDVTRINKANGQSVTVDESTAALLKEAIAVSQAVDGAFDITVRPLVELWGFPEKEQQVPAQDAIDSLLPIAGADSIKIDGNTVGTPSDVKIDLGGVGKGYCGESLRRLLREHGIESALLTLGGNVEAIGTKPDGSAWRIAIRDPQNEQNVLGVLEVVDCAVVTAGSYQRYFEQDGIQYHHILDPKTGHPAESGLSSVTVIAKSGTLADALSTAFFVMGTDASLALLNTEAFDDCSAVFVEDDGTVICSRGVDLLE